MNIKVHLSKQPCTACMQLESIGISILGTRMKTDYQDIKSYKNHISVKICENLCPNLN